MPISYILAVDAHRTVGRGQVELAPIGDRGAQHYPGVVYVCSDTGYELDTLLWTKCTTVVYDLERGHQRLDRSGNLVPVVGSARWWEFSPRACRNLALYAKPDEVSSCQCTGRLPDVVG